LFAHGLAAVGVLDDGGAADRALLASDASAAASGAFEGQLVLHGQLPADVCLNHVLASVQELMW
jgi:hypothetical protein